MSQSGTVNGYASYKVANTVTTHEAWGVGVYSYFRDAAVKANTAFEVPNVTGVKIHHATTIWLNGMAGSEITHLVNNLGGRVYGSTPADAMRQTLAEVAGTGTVTPDTQAPSVPASLTATAASSSQINLSWAASTDNVGVTGYDIYRAGALIASSTTTTYSNTGLAASTAYSYTIKAKDAAGNVSAASSTVSATTQAATGGTGAVLARTGWTASSTPTSGDVAANLLDGSMATRWSTGAAMVPGQSVIVDMKATKTFNKIVRDSTGSDLDYARGYEVYVSNDGTTWGTVVATGAGTGPIVTSTFTARTARYIKVVQTGTNSSWWSAREFNVYY
jgi:chitodextrinase